MVRPKKSHLTNTFDAPWKAALECDLEPFLRLCFPRVHRLIDWRTRPVFLDKDLQQLASDLPQGNVTADKLIELRRRDGQRQVLFVHIEVQAQPDKDFEERMWIYHYRIYDRVRGPLISLAVLADRSSRWRPSQYREEWAGCLCQLRFPTFKVVDCPRPELLFARTGNPFALVIAAHQVALRTMGDPEQRLDQRLRLVRYLVGVGLPRSQAVRLLRFIRWLTRLPSDLELKFEARLATLKQDSGMKTIDMLTLQCEERALKKGRRQGREIGRQEGRAALRLFPNAARCSSSGAENLLLLLLDLSPS